MKWHILDWVSPNQLLIRQKGPLTVNNCLKKQDVQLDKLLLVKLNA